MEDACAESLPNKAVEGIELFNRREFFACHEALEAAWLAERRPVRRLYQGILQVGVGFHHLGRNNWDGAVKLLASAIENLEAFRPACQAVDVEALYLAACQARDALLRAGPARGLDPALIPSVRIIDQEITT